MVNLDKNVSSDFEVKYIFIILYKIDEIESSRNEIGFILFQDFSGLFRVDFFDIDIKNRFFDDSLINEIIDTSNKKLRESGFNIMFVM